MADSTDLTLKAIGTREGRKLEKESSPAVDSRESLPLEKGLSLSDFQRNAAAECYRLGYNGRWGEVEPAEITIARDSARASTFLLGAPETDVVPF